MNHYNKGDRVMTSFGIPGELSQPIFDKASGKITHWIVSLDKPLPNGANEVHQSIMQLSPL